MGIENPQEQPQNLDSLIKDLSDKEKDVLLETLKKDKTEREAQIIKKLEERYEKVRKLGENAFLVKNNNNLRILVNSNGNEIYKGLRFEGRFVKGDFQVLKLLNQMFEPIISEEGDIIFKSCSSGNLVDIEYLLMMSKCKETENKIRQRYRKMERSVIFNDIYFVKKYNNPLWYILGGDGHRIDIPGFVEYEEKADGLRVKRRDGEGFQPERYLIKEQDLNTKKISENIFEGDEESERELETKYSIIEKEDEGEYYIAQKKGKANELVILDKDGKEVKEIPSFEEYNDDGEVLQIKVKEKNGYKRYDVHRDPREIIENIYLNIEENVK